MQRSGAGTDHQIQSGHDGRSVRQIVHLLTHIEDMRGQRVWTEVISTRPDLQYDELDARYREERRDVGKTGGAEPIALCPGVAGPDNAHPQRAMTDPFTPA